MIKRYIERTQRLLDDYDNIREVFNQETKNLENYIEHETSKKCTNAFMTGMTTTAIMFGIINYLFLSDYGVFFKQVIKGLM